MSNLLLGKRNTYQTYRVGVLQERLRHTSSYEEWKELALKLDQEMGPRHGNMTMSHLISMLKFCLGDTTC